MKVEYMCHSGDDLLVVNAARASFGKESDWEYVKVPATKPDENGNYFVRPGRVLSDRDTKLINFLAREKHVLPFRHPSITLRCRAPIFVARQLGKHQTGFSWSEESRRYISTDPEFYWPDKWRKKADNVKQGSSDDEVSYMTALDGTPLVSHSPQYVADYVVEKAVEAYNALLRSGVAPEQARTILPQNMMITWVWTGTLLAWHHMLSQRLASDTQRETQAFAKMVEEIITPLYPVSLKALREHA